MALRKPLHRAMNIDGSACHPLYGAMAIDGSVCDLLYGVMVIDGSLCELLYGAMAIDGQSVPSILLFNGYRCTVCAICCIV